MKTQLNRELEIFAAAVALPQAERAAYLQTACAGDEKLRQQVQALLDAHSDAGTFMQSSPAPVARDGLLADEAVVRIVVTEKAGDRIGRYKLLQQIGEGGMGVVYMAEQEEPVRRRVALKIIKLGMDTRQVVARFEAERQALALMDHPNIAKVLDGGCTEPPAASSAGCQPAVSPTASRRGSVNEETLKSSETSQAGSPAIQQTGSLRYDPHYGRPYFVMELVKGQPLTKFCDEHKLSTRERLELFIPICQAIQHAHQKGIIHRDIKPSNILVTTIDGVPRPKVIDFGVAKATDQKLTGKTLFTNFDTMIGTPAYMSPEQAALDSTDIDTRSDIYSLGVLLYELLTGKTPIEAKELTRGGYDEIRRRIREIEPPRPSNRLNTLTGDELTTVARSRAIEPARLPKLIRGELDWIVLKAMDKDRSRRYETASAFAQDIRRYLDGEPVTAVKPSAIYQFQKFARRHKVVLATASSFALLLTVSACVSTAQAIKNKSLFTAAEEARLKEMSAKQRETELRRIAETERARAETERDRSQRLLYTANMNLAQRAWEDAKISRVTQLLDLHRPQQGQPDLRSFEWYYLDRLCNSELRTLDGHAGGVASVAFSPDGKRLASGNWNRVVKIWDFANGQEILTFKGHTNIVRCAVFSPDGKWLASASDDHTVKLWDAATGRERLTLHGYKNNLRVAFSPDGKQLASASRDQTVRIWDASTGREILTLKGHTNDILSVAFSPDGKRLASASRDFTVKLWDVTTGRETLTLKGHTDGVTGVAFSPDGNLVASAGHDGMVKLWDAGNGNERFTLIRHTAPFFGVVFSPDGKRLGSATYDQLMKVWDVASGEELLNLKGHTAGLWGVAFSPDGRWLVSAGGEGKIKIWDPTKKQESLTLRGHTNWVTAVVFSPDGKRLASASADQTVKVWDAATGQEALTLKGHTNIVLRLAFSPDGNRLVSGSRDQTVKVWDATSGKEMLTLRGHTGPVRGVAFSPDGKKVASASADATARVWDAATGQELLTFKGHTNFVRSVAFSPDGKSLASSGDDQTVRLWDTTSGQEKLAFKGHTHYSIEWVAFSPDGKRLATAGFDQTIRLWEAATGNETLTLTGHTSAVRGVAFSPDGNRLASTSGDGTLKVWDLTTGQEMLTLKGPGGGGVAFSPDGYRLASAGEDQTMQIWDATPRTK